MRKLRGQFDVAVIGAGLAGLAAALYAARCGRAVVVFEGAGILGGQVAKVNRVDGLTAGAPGTGQAIATGMADACAALGAELVQEGASVVKIGNDFEIVDATGKSRRAKTLIVASGGTPRTLGVPGEASLDGRGIAHCATCDGPLFAGEDVVVVGGGDGALHEALALAAYCRKVTVLCRGRLRAKRQYVEQAAQQPNLEFIWDATVDSFVGDGALTGVVVRVGSDASPRTLACAGAFVSIGVTPSSALLPPELVDTTGHMRTDMQLATARPGLYAAGAVRAGFGGEAAQALADGITAAQQALHFIDAGARVAPAVPSTAMAGR